MISSNLLGFDFYASILFIYVVACYDYERE